MNAQRVLGILALTFLTIGCGPTATGDSQPIGRLRLGTVDIMRVMEEKPETVQIKLEWAHQAGQTYTALAKNVDDPVKYAELQKQIAKQSGDWQKKMDSFMEKSISEIETEAQKLAREKNLDLVLVDNTLTQILKYHEGVDLTTDILFRLQSSSGN